MGSNCAGFAVFGLATIHNPQMTVSDPKFIYFSKIDQTIRLLLNSEENEPGFVLAGKNFL